MASQEYHHVNLVFEIKQIVSWQLRGEAGSGCGEIRQLRRKAALQDHCRSWKYQGQTHMPPAFQIISLISHRLKGKHMGKMGR